MSELKFVITGTPGVGKSTAILAISDIPPVITDEVATDELAEIKEATTVAFDFGEVIVDDETVVRIYGTPGQERFQHMWEIIADGALGLMILVDCTRADPIDDLFIYVDNFEKLIQDTGVVVGLTRATAAGAPPVERFFEALEKRGIVCPVIEVDPREKTDMIMLLDTLMAILEYS